MLWIIAIVCTLVISTIGLYYADVLVYEQKPCRFCSHQRTFKSYLPFLSYQRWQCCQKAHDNLKKFECLRILLILGILTPLLWQDSLWFWANDVVFFVSLILLAFIDWQEYVIETWLVVIAIFLRIAWISVFELSMLTNFIVAWLIGAGGLYWISFFYETIRKRSGIGEGDPAIFGMIGLWVGALDLLTTLFLASCSGAIVGAIMLKRDQKPIDSTPIPFVPFLVIGGLTTYVVQKIYAQSMILLFFDLIPFL